MLSSHSIVKGLFLVLFLSVSSLSSAGDLPLLGGPSANGTPCLQGADCMSSFCVDSVCCDVACQGACQACSAAQKESGQNDGVCGSAKAGTNPRDLCVAHDSSDPCGTLAECDGSGSCKLEPQSTACGDGQCTGGLLVSLFCNGLGDCLEDTPIDCSPYSCNIDACAAPCSSELDCVAGYICSQGQCVSKKSNGEACSASSDCASGFCVDAVCCSSVCNQPCEACAESGSIGTCTVISSGQPRGARPACEGAGTTCGGECQGVASGCVFPGAGTTCSQGPSCDGDTALGISQCDGAGLCAVSTYDCTPYRCDSTTFECIVKCTSDDDCSGGFACSETGVCFDPTSTCIDDSSVKQKDGTAISCAPYICKNDRCLTTCSSDTDCVSPSQCSDNRCITTGGQGGSSNTGGSGGSGGTPSSNIQNNSADDSGCSVRPQTNDNVPRGALSLAWLIGVIMLRFRNRQRAISLR